MYSIFAVGAHDIVLTGRTVKLSSAKAIDGSEGNNLLSALTAFVKVVINPPPDVDSGKGEVPNWLNIH